MRVIQELYVFWDYLSGKHEQRVEFRKRTKHYREQERELRTDLKGAKADCTLKEIEKNSLENQVQGLEEEVKELAEKRGNALSKAHQARRNLEARTIQYQQAEQDYQVQVEELKRNLQTQIDGAGFLKKQITKQRRELEDKRDWASTRKTLDFSFEGENIFLARISGEVFYQSNSATKLIKGRLRGKSIFDYLDPSKQKEQTIEFQDDYYTVSSNLVDLGFAEPCYLLKISKPIRPKFMMSKPKAPTEDDKKELIQQAEEIKDNLRKTRKELGLPEFIEQETQQQSSSHDDNVPLEDN